MPRRPSPSAALSALALFVALGGTSYAAIDLARNSVGGPELRKNSVGATEIKRGAVRSADVRDRSLRARDFAAGQLPAGAPGPQGPAGLQGATGPTGATGATGIIATASDSSTSDQGVCCNETVDSDPLEATITTSAPARLLANAAIRIKAGGTPNTGVSEVLCKVTLDAPPPATATGPAIGQEMAAVLPAQYSGGVSLAATARTGVLPPGTYNVALHCLPGDGAGADQRIIDAGDITVLAVRDP